MAKELPLQGMKPKELEHWLRTFPKETKPKPPKGKATAK